MQRSFGQRSRVRAPEVCEENPCRVKPASPVVLQKRPLASSIRRSAASLNKFMDLPIRPDWWRQGDKEVEREAVG